MKIHLIVLFIITLIITSCSAVPNGLSSTETPIANNGNPSGTYPAPASISTSYPGSNNSDFPAELPKNLSPVSNAVGTVTGRLTHTSKNENLNSYPAVYLGDIKMDTNGIPLVASLDKITAPKAIIDQKGNFAFLNVVPGNYLLMVDIIDSFVTKQTADGKEQLINLAGGQTIDMGEIQIP